MYSKIDCTENRRLGELFRIFKYKLSRMVRICKCYHLKIKTTDEKLGMGITHVFSFVCKFVKPSKVQRDALK